MTDPAQCLWTRGVQTIGGYSPLSHMWEGHPSEVACDNSRLLSMCNMFVPQKATLSLILHTDVLNVPASDSATSTLAIWAQCESDSITSCCSCRFCFYRDATDQSSRHLKEASCQTSLSCCRDKALNCTTRSMSWSDCYNKGQKTGRMINSINRKNQ